MANLEEKGGSFDVVPGAYLEPTIEEAITLAKNRGCVITFEFNGTLVTVDASTNLARKIRSYHRSRDEEG